MNPTWEEFVELYAQKVLDAALRVLGNPDDADEVAQEVFLEIFRNKRMAEFYERPALMRTLSTRRAIDRIRRRRTTDSLENHELYWQGSDPSATAIAAELDRHLHDALASLGPREAEVFALSAFEGFTACEISELLQISSGAVAKSLCTARAKVSRFFEHKNLKVDP